VLSGTVETEGAHAMSDLPENSQSVVCGHCHLLIIDIAPTHAKVDIEQQRFGAF
jgi:hypothetical protein